MGAASSTPSPSALGCPSVPTSTVTSVVTSFSLSFTTTSTITTTQGAVSYTTITSTVQPTFIVASDTSTDYTSTTRTSTSFLTVSASTVTTVPTSDGFTPVSCLAAYLNPTVTSTTTSTLTYRTYAYVTQLEDSLTTSTKTSYIQSPIISTTPSLQVVHATTTFTETTTLTTTVSAVYEACSANNLASVAPDGTANYPINPQSAGTTVTTVLAADAAGCCGLCQADTNCAGSAFLPPGIYAGSNTSPTCRLYITSSCDPTKVGEQASYGRNATDSKWTISDSGCGQWSLTYAKPAFD
ncbi:hypothetical protein AMS68_003469 [Peltaster fructicola]|uniref:Apple domain-containing protein n=1 Tax=Peltaster fructicola TaxID=286661 RepID=A0A6H0XT52_9PEZI|nr:hypothetical protein AMS68_003469 [Peltaster fructicola]